MMLHIEQWHMKKARHRAEKITHAPVVEGNDTEAGVGKALEGPAAEGKTASQLGCYDTENCRVA